MAGIYKLFQKRRTVFYTICFSLAVLLLPYSIATAQDSSGAAFTVRGIEVDVTDQNAALAREKAFAQAQQEAFQRLAERLLSKNQLQQFVLPELLTISTLVKDFEVTEERISSVRYIGTYTFRFKSDDVRNYLSLQGLAYSDVASKPVLVLPYYQWGSRTVLWGENNPWLMAWNQMQSYGGLVPVIVPIGDLQDVGDIGDNEALTYSPEDLRNMVQRYGAGEAVIMLAMPQWTGSSGAQSGTPPSHLTIMVYRTDRGAPEFVNKLVVTAENSGDVFAAAVQETRESLQQSWKNQTMVSAAQGNQLKVRVKFDNMQEWVETQKMLREVQGIDKMNLISLTPSEADIELFFQGSENRLRLALSQADMTLTAPRIDFSRGRQDGRSGNSYGGYARQPDASPLVYDLYLNKYQRY